MYSAYICLMIAVVTGSSGFIGSHLVDALLARGATVRAILRPSSPTAARDPRVEYHTIDLLDPAAVRATRVWDGATHVFHVGGVTKAHTLERFRDGNVRPTANIFAALASQPRPPRVIFVSSFAAAGPAPSAERFLTETDEPRPIEAYGISKLEAERIVAQYADRVPAVVVRPPAVYGPRDRDFLHAFRQAAARVAFHAASREQLISILYVSDLIAGMLSVAEHPAVLKRTFFLANDAPTTWGEFYGIVARAAQARPLELQLPRPLLRSAALAGDLVGFLTGNTPLLNRNKVALTEPRWWTCSAARANRELDWQPRVELHDGLRDTYVWYVRTGWMRGARPLRNARPTEEPKA